MVLYKLYIHILQLCIRYFDSYNFMLTLTLILNVFFFKLENINRKTQCFQ